MTPSPQRNIEDVLCSKTRLKILKVLLGSQLTPSEIARAVGVNYVITEQHLEILESAGILSHAKFGKRIRYYRYNETPKARAVQTFMKAFQESRPELAENEKSTKKRSGVVLSVVLGECNEI
jgi:predicted transcriptional regulator